MLLREGGQYYESQDGNNKQEGVIGSEKNQETILVIDREDRRLVTVEDATNKQKEEDQMEVDYSHRETREQFTKSKPESSEAEEAESQNEELELHQPNAL